MKQCTKCGKIKPKNQFYKNRSNADGLTYACADCMKQASLEYTETERGQRIKKVYNNSEKAKQLKRKWQRSTRGKQKRKENKAKHDLHIKARRAINNAVRDGKLKSASAFGCKHCERKAKEYHHYAGYKKEHWLDVIPLCRQCHMTADKV